MGSSEAFVPAQSVREASARFFSLTGATPFSTRPPKRGLIALAQGLLLDVDLDATNAVMAQEIALKMNAPWIEGRDFRDGVVTLSGLNKLLRNASHSWLARAQQEQILEHDVSAVLRTLPFFRPAKTKLEVVNRISDLTKSGPEELGPGSKERKTVLINLAEGVGLEESTGQTKHRLAETLCQRFGMPWLEIGASTGQTVTLDGLNLILAGAERHFGVISAGWESTNDEAKALLEALRNGLSDSFDGRKTVKLMRETGSPQWRATEWPGFYFEERAFEILNETFPTPAVGGPRRKYGNTVFDYASNRRVWDLKAHSNEQIYIPRGERIREVRGDILLNDSQAMLECIDEQGLGFIVLSGASHYDETGDFDTWHRTYTREGREAPRTRANSDRRRLRKAAFVPSNLQALWIADRETLFAGFMGGWLSLAKIGRQQAHGNQVSGSARRPKLKINLHDALPLHVERVDW